jgi:hypothetical protein
VEENGSLSIFFSHIELKQPSRKEYQSLADITVPRLAQNFSAMRKNKKNRQHQNLMRQCKNYSLYTVKVSTFHQ